MHIRNGVLGVLLGVVCCSVTSMAGMVPDVAFRNFLFKFKDGGSVAFRAAEASKNMSWQDVHPEDIVTMIVKAGPGKTLGTTIDSVRFPFTSLTLKATGSFIYRIDGDVSRKALVKVEPEDAVDKFEALFGLLKRLDFPARGVMTTRTRPIQAGGSYAPVVEVLEEREHFENVLCRLVMEEDLKALCETADDLIVNRLVEEESGECSGNSLTSAECMTTDEDTEDCGGVDCDDLAPPTKRSVSLVNRAPKAGASKLSCKGPNCSKSLRASKDEDSDENDEGDCQTDDNPGDHQVYVDLSAAGSGVFGGLPADIGRKMRDSKDSIQCEDAIQALGEPGSVIWIYLDNNIYRVPTHLKRTLLNRVQGRPAELKTTWDFEDGTELIGCRVNRRTRDMAAIRKSVAQLNVAPIFVKRGFTERS